MLRKRANLEDVENITKRPTLIHNYRYTIYFT